MIDELASAVEIPPPSPPAPPAVALTAEQCAGLRFELSVGVTAMHHFAAYFGQHAKQADETTTREIADVYRYVDSVLIKFLGAGLVPYDDAASALDGVLVAVQRTEAESSKTAPSAAFH